MKLLPKISLKQIQQVHYRTLEGHQMTQGQPQGFFVDEKVNLLRSGF